MFPILGLQHHCLIIDKKERLSLPLSGTMFIHCEGASGRPCVWTAKILQRKVGAATYKGSWEA